MLLIHAVTLLLAAPVSVAAPAADLTPQQIYKKSGPAVVLLMCTSADGKGELGTGSLINADGQVLTNAHVVIDRGSGKPYASIRVYLKPRRVSGDPKRDLVDPYQGTVVDFDRDLDFAVVSLDRKIPDQAVLPLADSSAIEAGEPVVAIGHPEQGGLWTLTKGVVGAVLADLGGVKGKDVFQSDASINRGNSGGPLIDLSGAMVGINTSMARRAADGLAITSVNFAVQSNVVKKWLAKSGIRPSAAASAGAAASTGAPASPKTTPTAVASPEEAPGKEDEPEASEDESEDDGEPSEDEGDEDPAASGDEEEPVEGEDNILTARQPFSPEDLLKMDMKALDEMAGDMKSSIRERRKARPDLEYEPDPEKRKRKLKERRKQEKRDRRRGTRGF